MYNLKLIRGRSFSNGKIKADKTRPFIEVETLEEANALAQSGAFKFAGSYAGRPQISDEVGKTENYSKLESLVREIVDEKFNEAGIITKAIKAEAHDYNLGDTEKTDNGAEGLPYEADETTKESDGEPPLEKETTVTMTPKAVTTKDTAKKK